MVKGMACAVAAIAAGSVFAVCAPAHADPRAHMISWAGTVDDTVDVRIHQDDVQTQPICGRGVWRVHSAAVGALPDWRPVNVSLCHIAGRGSVRVVQQPRPENGFTVVVRIFDPQPGVDRYHFDMIWNGPSGRGDDDHRHDPYQGGDRNGDRGPGYNRSDYNHGDNGYGSYDNRNDNQNRYDNNRYDDNRVGY